MRQKIKENNLSGFTLIELLVVISVIGFLATSGLFSFNIARRNTRNVKRLADIRQTIKALEMYYDNNNAYPDGDNDGIGTYDIGNQTLPFLTTGGISRLGSIMPKPPRDPKATGNMAGYFYYRFAPGWGGCDANKGNFYVIMATMEGGSGATYPGSPGFNCPGTDWQETINFFANIIHGSGWVTGGYEKQ